MQLNFSAIVVINKQWLNPDTSTKFLLLLQLNYDLFR